MYGLRELLATADVLVTSMRPSALKRLGLDWTNLQVRYPKLCQIAIVGFPEPDQEQAGHDLSYQAALGLIEQDYMPRALIADIGGAERTVSAVLGALYLRATQQVARYQEVSLSEAAGSFALPYRHGLTATTGVLGGGFPGYNLYRASDGWLALAALEPHFWQRVQDGLGVDNPTSGELAHLFSLKGVEAWQKWAADLDIPLTIVNA
jgi:crotonobetainyl-CoA:carnitine CoA-transferase CaiB-like acyl-CoA transferase